MHKQRKKSKNRPQQYVRFVYKGNYYRRPIAPKHKKKPPELLKLPPAGPAVIPKPFITPPSTSVAKKAEELVAASATAGSSGQQSTWSWRSWLKLNYPLLILNFGSLATLAGFTRTDVIELRSLAITGNVTFTIYSLLRPPPIQWNVLLYQFLFASVNAYNIVVILNERKGKVHLSPRQEEIYTEHFQPHGVSPKQFEKVMQTGQVRIIKKGEVLSRAGQCMSHVKLVVRGNTRANVMGRHLTAMGSMRGNRNSMQGGDSGAWIGEMAFLQSMWDKEHSPKVMQKKFSGLKKSNSATTTSDEDNNDTKTDASTINGTVIKSGGSTLTHCGDSEQSYCAISTIVTVEDESRVEMCGDALNDDVRLWVHPDNGDTDGEGTDDDKIEEDTDEIENEEQEEEDSGDVKEELADGDTEEVDVELEVQI